MEQLILILRHTQGVFLAVCDRSKITSDIRNDIVYIGCENDKKNITRDIFNVAADFKKSYNKAKLSYL